MRLTIRQRLILFTPATVLLVIGLVAPAVLGLFATFTTYSPFGTPLRFTGLANYRVVIGDPTFDDAVRNIVIFSVLAVSLELVIGFALAYLLRAPIRGRGLWRVVLLVPWLVSPIANGVMWHYLLGISSGIVDFGSGLLGRPELSSPLADPRLALATTVCIEVWRVAPFVAFLVLPGLLSIPADRWEVAKLDGASWLRTIRVVALPPLRPLLLAVTMILIGLSLGTLDTVVILTGGGPGTSTTTPALFSYDEAFTANDWPLGAAAAWLIAGGVLALGGVYVQVSRRRTDR